MLRVEGVTVQFGGLVAVHDASFAVQRAEIMGLIGPNGAGKTTLFNVISGVVRPAKGRVYLEGRDITDVPVNRRCALGVARTFQTVQLFDDLTVLENVMVGCHSRTRASPWACALHLPSVQAEEAKIRRRAERELEFVGLVAEANRPAAHLPLGQQRLLEIARALAADPVLLLLDEPASGLNSVEVDQLAIKLREVCRRGVTLLLVEHHVDLVMELCDSVVVLDRGAVIADGTPHQVRASPRVQGAYLGKAWEGTTGHVAG